MMASKLTPELTLLAISSPTDCNLSSGQSKFDIGFHAITHLIIQTLSADFEGLSPPDPGPKVILGLPLTLAVGDLLFSDLGVPGLDFGLWVTEIFGHGVGDIELAGSNPG